MSETRKIPRVIPRNLQERSFVATNFIVVAMVTAGLTAFVLVIARTRIPQPALTPASQTNVADTTRARTRNLSFQPEAFNMSRRLGQRFAPAKRHQSILTGTVTIGSEQRIVQTSRKQTDAGERVEIVVVGSLSLLTWEANQGALSSGARAGASDRELIERLVLDSPDQFVLAQLRGASYSTVARRVRPTDADENYAGPLWDIVRVDDPERDEQKKPQSTWRLYYINTRTRLIDRIVSQLLGETIEAEISDWTTLNGENVPGQITWRNQSQTLMQYRLTSFSHGQ